MSIHEADDNSSEMTDEAAEAALMASFEPPAPDGEGGEDDAKEGAEELPSDDGETPDDAGEEGGDDEGAEEVEGLPKAPPAAITDDTKVEVTIDGTAQEFTVGSLKRLAGQEASLTRKSQEADLVGGRAAAALQAAIEVVQEDLEPYKAVDWLVLQGQMDPETFAWHRENAQRLDAKFRRLVGAAQGFEQTITERRQNVDKEAREAALREMAADVPEWSDKAHADLLAYGASQGLDADDLARVNNAKVLKVIRKAMLFDKAQKVATEKVKQAPTKVIKPGTRSDTSAKQVSVKKAEKRLATSGSEEDAMAVLMGRWG